eukprot:2827342-Ditylum_brightwellii.AAC.1
MEKSLVAHHQQHFNQAYGTQFTIHPLCTIITEVGPTKFLKQLEDNEININLLKISDFTKDMLHWLKPTPKDPPIVEEEITTQQVQQRYKIWTENTSTPPEGRNIIHLAIEHNYPLQQWRTAHNIFIPQDKDNKKLE